MTIYDHQHNNCIHSNVNNNAIRMAFAKQNSMVATTRRSCIKWKITFSPITRPRFSNDFINGLMMLEEASNKGEEAKRKESYVRFTRHFGTHHLVQASYGASIYIHQVFETSSADYSQRLAVSNYASWAVKGCFGAESLQGTWNLEGCLGHKHVNEDSGINGRSSSRNFEFNDVLISSKGSLALQLSRFYVEDSDIVPITMKVRTIQEMIMDKWLSESDFYDFKKSLNATAIKLLLDEGLKKWYCNQVLKLPTEQCQEAPQLNSTATTVAQVVGKKVSSLGTNIG